MRVFGLGLGLGLEPSTVCGWVDASVSNVTRTHAIGVLWGFVHFWNSP